MTEVYGDFWDRTAEIRELCLNCRYADCFGKDGCEERLEIISRLKEQEREERQDDSAARKEVVINGIKKPLAEWCRVFGVNYQTVWQRIKKGMDPEEAMKQTASRGGARNYGQLIKIGNEKKNITEWLRQYHISWKTVNRYTRKNGCSRAEAVKALCEKKSRAILNLITGHRL